MSYKAEAKSEMQRYSVNNINNNLFWFGFGYWFALTCTMILGAVISEESNIWLEPTGIIILVSLAGPFVGTVYGLFFSAWVWTRADRSPKNSGVKYYFSFIAGVIAPFGHVATLAILMLFLEQMSWKESLGDAFNWLSLLTQVVFTILLGEAAMLTTAIIIRQHNSACRLG